MALAAAGNPILSLKMGAAVISNNLWDRHSTGKTAAPIFRTFFPGTQRCLELGGATTVTYIGDREADIYEEWVRVPNHQTHVLKRACRDRSIVGTTQTLFAYLSEQRCEGTYCFTVMADTRKGRSQWVALNGSPLCYCANPTSQASQRTTLCHPQARRVGMECHPTGIGQSH